MGVTLQRSESVEGGDLCIGVRLWKGGCARIGVYIINPSVSEKNCTRVERDGVLFSASVTSHTD